MYWIYCDTEFTGLDPITNHILEVGMVVTNPGTFKPLASYHSFVRPDMITPKTWDQEAQDIHKITIRQANAFPSAGTVCQEILKFLEPYKQDRMANLFISHVLEQSFWDQGKRRMSYGKIDFKHLLWMFHKEDLGYDLQRFITESNQLSTITLARKKGYKGNSLEAWAERLEVDYSKGHTAMFDTELLIKVHEFLMSPKKIKESSLQKTLF